MPSDAANQWTKFYTENTGIMYPAEAVIRIFKGSYPNLKMPKPNFGDKVLDVGCGDGRHFPLLYGLGLQISGSEITTEIASATADKLRSLHGLTADMRVGTCASLPWPDATFGYLLSWNSCYYMNTGATFEAHVAEMARVLKPSGWIVCSIPKTNCFIFENSDPENVVHAIIRKDFFGGLRDGERMRYFKGGAAEVEDTFASHFTNFCHASIDIDMFGLAYHWHVFTAERRA